MSIVWYLRRDQKTSNSNKKLRNYATRHRVPTVVADLKMWASVSGTPISLVNIKLWHMKSFDLAHESLV